MNAVFFSGSQSDDPPQAPERNGLAGPTGTLQERGGYPGHVRETSLYTEAELHPNSARAIAAGAIAALISWRAVRRR